MNFYIRHYLGIYNSKDQVQRCVICGEIIHDYRGSSYASNSDSTFPINNGWPPGEHFVKEGNPTYYTTKIGPNDLSSNCNAVFDKVN